METDKMHGENNPIPYRLSLKSDEETIKLFRMKSDKFHVFKYGTSASYLVGSDIVVAKDLLVEFLKSHSDNSISVTPIEVVQSVTNETLSPSLCDKLRNEKWATEFQFYPGLAGLVGYEQKGVRSRGNS
jgi:hypothetical protein